MTCVWIVNVLLTLLVTMTSGETTCSSNEVLEKCPQKCNSDHCPKNRLSDRTPCNKPSFCPTPECKCAFNYRRADNETCIPTTECPPFECPANEVYDACPSYCPTDSCSDALLNGVCPFLLLFVVNCSPSCKCTENFYRQRGVCVPYEECDEYGEQFMQEQTTIQP